MMHLYKPLPWQASLGYKVELTLRNGKPQCRAYVPEARVGFHQCSKPGIVQVDGAWLCKVHDPIAQAARETAAREKWERQSRARRIEWAAPRFLAALQQIADGHNDPRALAREVLGDLYRDPAESRPSDLAAKPTTAAPATDEPDNPTLRERGE